ncbi:TPA: hypothetical protein ACSTJ2_001323 [Serratia fonticola]
MSRQKKFDLWLVRLSYLSQTGLFFLTIFTLYYTVIPIFQNATLQESIAQKEIELKGLKKEVDELYISLRSELIKKFSVSVIANCDPSIHFIMQPAPSEVEPKKTFAESMDEVKRDIMFDLHECILRQEKKSPYINKLREDDKVKVSSAIKWLEFPLKKIQVEANNNMKDTDRLREIGKENAVFSNRMDDILEKMGVTVEQPNKERDDSYILLGTNMIVIDYAKNFRELTNSAFEPLIVNATTRD